MKLLVIQEFKDKETKALYGAGTVVEFAGVDRINDLVSRGLCRIAELDEAPADATDGKIPLFGQEFEREDINRAFRLTGARGVVESFKDDTIVAKIAELDEEGLKVFKESLLGE